MNRSLSGFKVGAALFAAGALLAGTAEACSITAWSATNTTAIAADAGGPPAIRRYIGLCALDAGADGKVVAENSPDNETLYRARFYFYPEITAGSAKIFSATASDNGAGGEVIGLSYNANGTLTLLGSGASVATVTGLNPAFWYGIEVTYRSGNELSMTVSGGGGRVSSSAAAAAGIPTAGVGSHALGFMSGSGTAGGGFQFDEFEASRSADAAIGFRNRGDAIPDSVYDIFDVLAILNEFRGQGLALGSSDAEEDGDVDIFDVLAVLTRFRTGSFPTP
jgi:hypothetical protein